MTLKHQKLVDLIDPTMDRLREDRPIGETLNWLCDEGLSNREAVAVVQQSQEELELEAEDQ